jgi:cleavage stimulation factor subunit 3
LDHVGLDANSSQIWRDYISFLKSQEVKMFLASAFVFDELYFQASNPLQQGEKTQLIRKVFHAALGLPLSQLEQIWKDYDAWEHTLNKELAKEMLAKMQQKFINAKTSKRERKRKSDNILFHMLSRPPAEGISAHLREYKQVIYWKQWIDFEKTNPQKLDNDKLRERVDFTYRQALMTLRHYPEIW